MFEGDMNLNGHNIEEYVAMAREVDDEDNVHHNAIRSIYRRWSKGIIPYTISLLFNADDRSRIAAAIQDYNKFTCIRWVPRVSQTDYVRMFKGNGCFSQVGKTGNRQSISLGDGCITKGIIMHEMMHAAGFFHEQSRNDRDSYITIRTENIESKRIGQFSKYSLNHISHLNTSYDYDSIMHYGPYAFSKNGQATIEPKQAGASIGQRERLSQTDIVKLNRLYQCDEGTTPSTALPPPATSSPTSSCSDRTGCEFFKRFDPECNTARMRASCRQSCGLCG